MNKKTILTSIAFIAIILLGLIVKNQSKEKLVPVIEENNKLDSLIKENLKDLKNKDSLIRLQKVKIDSLTKLNKKQKNLLLTKNEYSPQKNKKIRINTSIVNYIDKYLSYAKESQKLYGVPVSITLAQGILESACGKSNYAINRNNHFGIKLGNQYRFFDSVEECFNFHAKLLSKRYKVPSLDYIQWAYNLQKKGYATDPLYAEKLIAKIQQNNLNQYDA